ncbi:type II secretion system minor pseudopilin GspI [Aestuariicoccus sp. MJ-SS9]|uniref:type II secretion system minor pseudopilin GspI n=1 Tax=Aestuariicoccus sp. MJ-SS9 TaxID=3079855 RepID=UPI002915AC88|nr:type II secretion system minor pseudopilin GspI [Aestuariicoccus sp. MJ-SS9]MDU8912177.1 type II secretion system minor pseudopilin GspI [Aestuariicoccus sp. MJ-SS9]
MRRLRGDRGLTLLELVVAVAVLAIGSLAAVRVTDQSRQVISGATPRILARIVAENRAEELRLYGPGGGALPGAVEMGGQRFVIEVDRSATVGGLLRAAITVRSDEGPGAFLVTYLPRRGP